MASGASGGSGGLAVLARAVKAAAIVLGGVCTFVTFASIVGLATGNEWVRAGLGLVLSVVLPAVAVDRALPKKDAGKPRPGLVGDVVAIVLLGIPLLFIGLGQPVTRPLLVREGDRLAESGHGSRRTRCTSSPVYAGGRDGAVCAAARLRRAGRLVERRIGHARKAPVPADPRDARGARVPGGNAHARRARDAPGAPRGDARGGRAADSDAARVRCRDGDHGAGRGVRGPRRARGAARPTAADRRVVVGARGCARRRQRRDVDRRRKRRARRGPRCSRGRRHGAAGHREPARTRRRGSRRRGRGRRPAAVARHVVRAHPRARAAGIVHVVGWSHGREVLFGSKDGLLSRPGPLPGDVTVFSDNPSARRSRCTRSTRRGRPHRTCVS